MSSVQVEEIILAALCVSPLLLVGIGALYLLLSGDPCEEAGE